MNRSSNRWPRADPQGAAATRRLVAGAVAVTVAVLLGVTDRAPLLSSWLGFAGMLLLLWNLHRLGRQGSL